MKNNSINWSITIHGKVYSGGCTIDASVIESDMVDDVMAKVQKQFQASYEAIKDKFHETE